jgi:hypothetical protein
MPPASVARVAALAAGGSEADGAKDYSFMYSRSFYDLDGHGWPVMWMNRAAAEQRPEAFAACMHNAAPRPETPPGNIHVSMP